MNKLVMKPDAHAVLHPALRRALIKIKPEYFSWSTGEQERYRVAMPEEDQFKFDHHLLAALFNIRADNKQAIDTAFDDFDDVQHLLYNSTVLPIRGIGDDYFYLNEWLGDNETLLDYPTLYDYDVADHTFQETTREKELPDYQAKPYYGSLYLSWARLFIDGSFTYATLSMVSGYIYSQLDNLGFDRIDELIPHQYVEGPNHGKREGKGTLWDQRIDADGKEAQLDELRSRYYQYIIERWDTLAQQLDHQAQGEVYVIAQDWDEDPHIHFVFTDQTALQKIRFRHFMQDCRSILAENQILETLVAQESQAANAFLETSYQDILDNFDPTIVKFKQKRKIVLSDGALKDLL